ncbi:MAG TPA: hypothetical protein VK932_29480 [Kofleriaceae bacterium]|nr:hypothetical protein [Kofleriaceae bacterium]
MMRAWGCVLLAGCSFSAPSTGGDGGDDGGVDPRDDARTGVDAAVDAPPSSCSGVSYGAAPYTICLPAAPILPLMLTALGTTTVDTDTCAFTSGITFSGQKVAQAQAGAPMLCVIAASSVSISGVVTIRAQGSLPLALLSHGDLTLGGAALIDVSGDSTGAAGNAAGCTVVNGGNDQDGGGGGAGGSFQTRGGNGAAVSGGGAGSTAAQAATPTFLRGGCAGGAGGNAGSSAGGLGGRGGGAVYLLARQRLQIDGKIDASGSGGRATTGDGRGGGGGGGSGGMIALWGGNSIAVGTGAEVWANGGGAAGGSDGDSNRGGAGGSSPDPGSSGRGGAAGASGATAGGNGAIGTATGAAGGVGADKSGGGGGGGVGWIENVGAGAALSPGMFSPPAR